MLCDLPRPASSFASDTTAGAHPAVLDALVAASAGPAGAYGDDDWTARATALVDSVFEAETETLFAFGGTGANIVALGSVLRPWEAVICPATAHITTDECGAPERMAGIKLLVVDCPDGKLAPDAIEPLLQFRGDEHHVQPRIVSVTQSTELGTLYSVDELAALADVAHRHDLVLHVDGARIANAVAALGGDPVASVRDAGVDVLSFGGTKNGLVFGEATVFFDTALAGNARFVRKQAAQLPAKMRFIAAQFEALLSENRWLDSAGHANAMAARLAARVGAIAGVSLSQPPEVNAVFARMPRPAVAALEDWSFFYRWDDDPSAADGAVEVRWMANFSTTEEDVDRFAAGVAAAVAESAGSGRPPPPGE
jgi:threonine aldolase